MKILRLDLRAFGPFSDVVLDFEDVPVGGMPAKRGADGPNGKSLSPGLHFIFGPNEAGKSSALRALNALFFGFPSKTGDNFIHAYNRLRIGALLKHSDGSTLEIWRRKGSKNTLLEADESTLIDQEKLHRFLGGLDQALFASMFGLNRETLVKGGQEILQGGGQLGQILFAAGSGFADLRAAEESLQNEMEEYFRPAAKTRKINQAIIELIETRDSIKRQQLSPEEWGRHDRTLRESQERRQDLQAKLEKLRFQQQRLSGLRSAMPSIRRRQEVLRDLVSYRDQVLLAEDFSDRRLSAQNEMGLAQQREKDAQTNLEVIDRSLETLNVPQDLLENAEAIEDLHRRLAEYHRAFKDRPERALHRQQREKEALEIWHSLGRTDAIGNAELLRLRQDEILALRHLAEQNPRLLANWENARLSVARRQKSLEEIQETLKQLDHLPDLGELRRLLRQMQPTLALEHKMTHLRQSMEQNEANLRTSLPQLPLWQGRPEDLLRLPVPPAAAIDAVQANWDQTQNLVFQLERQLVLAESSYKEAEGQLQEMESGNPVPTETDVQKVRGQRNAAWDKLQKNVFEQKAIAPPLLQEISRLIGEADHLADRMFQDGELVGRKTELIAQKTRAEQTYQQLAVNLTQARTHQSQVIFAWRQLWQPLGIEPLSPAEMKYWCQFHGQLSSMVIQIQREQTLFAQNQAQVEAGKKELKRAIEAVEGKSLEALISALTPLGSNPPVIESLDDCWNICQDRLVFWDNSLRNRQDLLKQKALKEQELAQAKANEGNTQNELGRWQEQWTRSMKRLGLEAEAAPQAAFAWFDSLARIRSKLDDAESYRKRMETLDQTIVQFSQDVTRVIEAVMPGVAPPPPQAVLELYDRLKKTRLSHEKFDTLQKQSSLQAKKLEEARESISKFKAQLQLLCQEASGVTPEELIALEDRSRRRRQLERDLAQVETQLAPLRGETSWEDFVAEVSQFNPEQVELDLKRLKNEEKELTDDLQEANQTIGGESAEINRMNGAAGAAETAQRAELLSAQLQTDVKYYVILRLASGILNKGIELYRQKSEGSILSRAGRIFNKLTNGSFGGLEIGSNEKDEHFLWGVRAREGKEQVPVEGMSDGTRDQLFLALRLASLEVYFEKHEPIPFVVDDLLLHFDDQRAVLAIQALLELSRKTQVLFFTHHQHLLDLAEQHFPQEGIYYHQMPGKAQEAVSSELF